MPLLFDISQYNFSNDYYAFFFGSSLVFLLATLL